MNGRGSKDLLFVDSQTGVSIRLHECVLNVFETAKQKRFFDKEQGGLLFALLEAEDEVLVCSATSEKIRNRSGRYWLKLDYSASLDAIEEHHAKGEVFIGYWHTHPQSDPAISPEDVRSFIKNVVDGGHGLCRLLALIVGDNSGPCVSAYMVSSSGTEKLEKSGARNTY